MPAPSTLEARNLHREAQALIEQAAIQKAGSSAFHIRQQGSTQDDGGAQGPEPSVHVGGAAERPANLGRTPIRERILDRRGQAQDGDARNVINARRTGNAETRETGGLPPPTGRALRQSRRPLADTGAPGNPCVQPGDPHSEFPSALPLAHVDRQIQQGDGPPRMAQ
jgi:hypothetical protein